MSSIGSTPNLGDTIPAFSPSSSGKIPPFSGARLLERWASEENAIEEALKGSDTQSARSSFVQKLSKATPSILKWAPAVEIPVAAAMTILFFLFQTFLAPFTIIAGSFIAAIWIGVIASTAVSIYERVEEVQVSRAKDFQTCKETIGISKSPLNRAQLAKLADLKSGTVFPLKTRLTALKNVLIEVENSLSKGAHVISKKLGQEKRFFDFEGNMFMRNFGSDASARAFIQGAHELKEHIALQVKETDQYTQRSGDSLSAVNLREYIYKNILNHAQEYGLSERFIKAAVEEPATFIHTIQKGLAEGLIPKDDQNLYSALVKIGKDKVAQVQAKNKQKGRFAKKTDPRAEIGELAHKFESAGLLSEKTKFISDVFNPNFKPNDAKPVKTLALPVLPEIQQSALSLPLEPIDSESVPVLPPFAQLNPQTAQETLELTDAMSGQLSTYLNALKELSALQQQAIGTREELNSLLEMKKKNYFKDLKTDELRALVTAAAALQVPPPDLNNPAGIEKALKLKEAVLTPLAEKIAQQEALCKGLGGQISKELEQRCALAQEFKAVKKTIKENSKQITAGLKKTAELQKKADASVQARVQDLNHGASYFHTDMDDVELLPSFEEVCPPVASEEKKSKTTKWQSFKNFFHRKSHEKTPVASPEETAEVEEGEELLEPFDPSTLDQMDAESAQ